MPKQALQSILRLMKTWNQIHIFFTLLSERNGEKRGIKYIKGKHFV